MGADCTRLTAAYVATRTFREHVFGETSGAGTTGVDDRYAVAFFGSRTVATTCEGRSRLLS
jgi:hypothetical protein